MFTEHLEHHENTPLLAVFSRTAKTTVISLIFIKPDTVTPVVRLQLLLAYWQDI